MWTMKSIFVNKGILRMVLRISSGILIGLVWSFLSRQSGGGKGWKDNSLTQLPFEDKKDL